MCIQGISQTARIMKVTIKKHHEYEKEAQECMVIDTFTEWYFFNGGKEPIPKNKTVNIIEKIAILPSELKYQIMKYIENPHGFKPFTEETRPWLKSRFCECVKEPNHACHCTKYKSEEYYNYESVRRSSHIAHLFLQQWDSSKNTFVCGLKKKKVRASYELASAKYIKYTGRTLSPSKNVMELEYKEHSNYFLTLSVDYTGLIMKSSWEIELYSDYCKIKNVNPSHGIRINPIE